MTLNDLDALVKHGFDGVDQRIDKGEQLQSDMLEELNATHADVRHIRSTVDALVHTDMA